VHTQTYSHEQTLRYSYTHSHICTLTSHPHHTRSYNTFTPSSRAHTHSHKHSDALTHTLTHAHSHHTHSYTHTHIHQRVHPPTHSCSITHTQAHSCTYTHAHTHTYTHSGKRQAPITSPRKQQRFPWPREGTDRWILESWREHCQGRKSLEGVHQVAMRLWVPAFPTAGHRWKRCPHVCRAMEEAAHGRGGYTGVCRPWGCKHQHADSWEPGGLVTGSLESSTSSRPPPRSRTRSLSACAEVFTLVRRWGSKCLCQMHHRLCARVSAKKALKNRGSSAKPALSLLPPLQRVGLAEQDWPGGAPPTPFSWAVPAGARY